MRDKLAEWYKDAFGDAFVQPSFRPQFLRTDLFRAFPTTRERQAWYASHVVSDYGQAQTLLDECIGLILLSKLKLRAVKRVSKSITKQVQRFVNESGSGGILAIAENPTLLEALPELLPAAMEWIEKSWIFCDC